MLPVSHSVQNVNNNNPGLTSRSKSTFSLAEQGNNDSNLNNTSSNSNPFRNTVNHGTNGAGGGGGGGKASPTFSRSASTGTNQTSPVVQQPYGFTRSVTDIPASPSPRLAPTFAYSHSQSYQNLPPRTSSSSHGPGHASPSHTPSLYHSSSVSHFGSYDSRLVANTINKIESSNTSSTLASSNSGPGSSSSAAPPGSSGGVENDAWTAVCIRTLPLFNGEGQRGYIEDLNDFVSLHIKRTTDRMGRTVQALSALASDLVDLLAMGMLTLNAKLADLSDERLLVRITEVWNFFFIGCLPYIEGIFLPLRTDNILRNIVNPASHGTGARSMSFNSSSTRDSIEAIDIRRIALRAFRDHLVLPIVDRLAVLFSSPPPLVVAHPAEPSSRPGSTSNVSSTTRTASARRLQMVSILIGVQTNDERQAATEALGKALRAGMDKQAPDSASHPVPVAFTTGPYGSAVYSHAARAAGKTSREAERKAWRMGRQMLPSPGRANPSHGSRSRAQSAEHRVDIQAPRSRRPSETSHYRATEVQDEGRYLKQLRSPELRDIRSPSHSNNRNIPEVNVFEQ